MAFLMVSVPAWRKKQSEQQSLRRQLKVLDPSTVQIKPYTNFQDQATMLKLGQKPLFDPSETDPWKRELFQRLDRIREVCGELCTINDRPTLEKYTVPPPAEINSWGRQVKVPVQCDAIMLHEEIDAGDTTVPFPPPSELVPYYAMNGLVNYKEYRKLVNVYLGGDQTSSSTWTQETLNEYIKNCDNPNEFIYKPYGMATNALKDSLQKHVPMKGSRVLVIGTEKPWVEAIALYLGAAHVTTLEFGKINNEHPQITTLTPPEFRALYREGKIEPFDVVVTFSSLEHAGLGRYGDALNPWGDLLAVARARCVTKPGGYLAIGLPTGGDTVFFNDNRQYGKNRYPVLTANWVQVDAADHADPRKMSQPPFILRNSGW